MPSGLLLSDLVLEHIGPFRSETSVQFGNALTFLIGPNGAGKSTVIDAVRALRDEGLKVEESMPERIFEPLPKDVTKLIAVLAFKRNGMERGARRRDAMGWTPVKDDFIAARRETTASAPGRSIVTAFLRNDDALRIISPVLSKIAISEPEPLSVAEGRMSGRTGDSTEAGSDAASSYAQATESQKELILDGLRHVASDVKDIVAYAIGGRSWATFHVKGQELTGHEMSTGTLRTFAVLTAIETAPDGSLLLIEEPDAFVDPNAMGVIIDSLIANSERLQIIATTHSPDLLVDDRIKAEMLRVVHRGTEGSMIKQLPERLARVLDDQVYTAGALLRSGLLSEGAW